MYALASCIISVKKVDDLNEMSENSFNSYVC